MAKQHVYDLQKAPVSRHENQLGGEGAILKHTLLESPNQGSLFAAMGVMTIPPGASVGLHPHPHNEEAYIIITGTGVYTSDKGEHPVGPGDIALCFCGEKHGITNTGKTDMRVAGIIAQAPYNRQ